MLRYKMTVCHFDGGRSASCHASTLWTCKASPTLSHSHQVFGHNKRLMYIAVNPLYEADEDDWDLCGNLEGTMAATLQESRAVPHTKPSKFRSKPLITHYFEAVNRS